MNQVEIEQRQQRWWKGRGGGEGGDVNGGELTLKKC